MTGHTHNPSTWRLRQEDCEFKANLDYTERHCLKKPRAGDVAECSVLA
jgi:hypothetical protein